MRDIKFRAWHKESKEFLRGEVQNMFSWLSDGQPVELMQFIGTKDCVGIDIYEGDICFLVDSEYQNEQYEVAYSDSQCKFYLKDHAGRLQGFMDDYDLKVIGNIYQNPELIGVCS